MHGNLNGKNEEADQIYGNGTDSDSAITHDNLHDFQM